MLVRVSFSSGSVAVAASTAHRRACFVQPSAVDMMASRAQARASLSRIILIESGRLEMARQVECSMRLENENVESKRATEFITGPAPEVSKKAVD